IYITQVNDIEEGLELLAALTDAINATWENRTELVPLRVGRRAPRHLDIYALLPQTNCKQCGEATCLAFAVQLILQQRTVDECTPLLQDPAFQDRMATLVTML
ncbi:MAG TPA: (Fe-S)-binding protein, partial [Anaerolineales bacterium]